LDCYLPWRWTQHWPSSNYLTVPALELVVWYVGRCTASSQPYWWWCGNYQDSDTLQLSLLSDNYQYTTLGLCLTLSLFHDVTFHSLCTPVLEPMMLSNMLDYKIHLFITHCLQHL
jgi:hypothetical protein